MSNITTSKTTLSCYTTVAWRIILSSAQLKTVAASVSVLILPTILLNFAVCIALFKTKQLKSSSRFLVFVLSVSDLIAGIFTIPLTVILFTLFGNTRSCWFERMLVFVGGVNGHFSLYIILAIAIQRYLKIKASPKSSVILARAFQSKSGLRVLVFACGVWSILHGLVSVYFFGAKTNNIPNIIMMFLRTIIMLIIYVYYFRLYFTIKKHVQNRARWQQPGKQQRQQKQKQQQPHEKQQQPQQKQQQQPAQLEMKARSTSGPNVYDAFFKTVFLILVIFAVCYVPVLAFDVWTGYYTLIRKTAAPQLSRFLYFLAHCPMFMNSTLNAAVFLYRDKNARDYIMNQLGCASSVDVKECRSTAVMSRA